MRETGRENVSEESEGDQVERESEGRGAREGEGGLEEWGRESRRSGKEAEEWETKGYQG